MVYHLRAAGTSLVLDARGTRVPVVVHWGGDLGDLSADELALLADSAVPAIAPSSVDIPLRLSLLPTPGEGWSGRPGVSGFRAGSGAAALELRLVELRLVELRPVELRPVELRPVELRQGAIDPAAPFSLAILLTDAAAGVDLRTELELSVHGVLRLRHTLTNTDASAFELGSLDVTLPVPDRAAEILDFTGLWSHERRPQRGILGHGVWSRESRHGRPGHDDAFLTVAGTPGFGFRTGEVWATHLAWSGDKRSWAERSPLGAATLGSGELLAPGELSLAAGASYTSPWTVAVYSDAGLDGLSARLHPWIRSWSTLRTVLPVPPREAARISASERTPVADDGLPARRPRPVVLNTWEAVYFDHDLPTLTRLADAAARVGVELFVLDDGWFTGRSDDRRALGDWFVDPAAWPDGLHPLISHVRGAGLDFGLWVEPEMVSPDSDLARRHPDWVLGTGASPTWRFQRVLDLDNPEAFAWLLARLGELLTEYPISYLKWDHNRDLLAGSAHRQTTALYRLIDAVRAAHPEVEIESCASGGARIDLGILERVDRVWTSDTNDPLERQLIQRYTGILLPPEYLGGHLGAATAHTTGRTADLGFRLATALFGSAGIEWDLTEASEVELDAIADWVARYKELRPLLHSGTVVRADPSDPALQLHGVVSTDRASAVFAYVALAAPRTALPSSLRFPGLDPERSYRVAPLALGAPARTVQDAPPGWLAAGGIILPGSVLALVGLPAPLLSPEQAALYTVDAVPARR